MKIPLKTKTRVTTWPTDVLLEYIYMEKMKTNAKRYMHPMFTAALLIVAKTWKQPKCPVTDEWIKMWYVYIMEYYSAIKKKQCHLQQHGST